MGTCKGIIQEYCKARKSSRNHGDNKEKEAFQASRKQLLLKSKIGWSFSVAKTKYKLSTNKNKNSLKQTMRLQLMT